MRETRVEGYRNIYELLPNETKVYGTETLYPDWNAPLLLLAKDFAASRVVIARMANGESDPYRHADRSRGDREGTTTNIRLQRLVSESLGEHFPLLYGSAYAGLLRDDGRMSGSHNKNGQHGLAYGARVLRWVLDHMPNRLAIACLGREAWNCSHLALNASEVGQFELHRDSRQPLVVSGLVLFAHYHPAARRLPDHLRRASWNAMASQMRSDRRYSQFTDAP